MSDEVGAYHLLIKHSGSRNPVSRRTNKATTMSKEEAIAELTALKATISPENFQQKAQEVRTRVV